MTSRNCWAARVAILCSWFASVNCGHSAITATTGPTVGVQPPATVSSGQQFTGPHNLRPELLIRNAMSIGPVGGLSYRFEVATNPVFSPVLLAGTVPQGTTTDNLTSFPIPSDLALATFYYWRAQAQDPRSGAASAFSDVRSFTTIAAPSNGDSTLLIDFADSCASFFGEREFSIDGRVITSGVSWQFVAPAYLGSGQGLTLNLNQSGTSLAGTLAGSALDRMRFPLFTLPDGAGFATASASGSLRANGDASGTFDGAIRVLHQSFGLGASCSGTGFRWTVTQGIG